MNKIECKICNKSFKIVTSAHLKSHNISVAEYRKHHGHTVCQSILDSWSLKRRKEKPAAELLDESNSVKCSICGERHRALNLHLRYKHNISPSEYVNNFPGAALYSDAIKDKMKENSFMKTQKGISFEQRLGKEKADTLKQQLSVNATNNQTGKKRSESFKQNMRDTWDVKREEWRAAIKKSSNRPEVKEKQSKSQKARMIRDGYHLARGKETSLEKFVRETLEANGFTVIRQKGTQKLAKGTVRFFDIFVPELNLVIEADGEWWHRTLDRIDIDKDKTKAAVLEGYSFLRISDKEFKKHNHSEKHNHSAKKLMELILLPADKQLALSNDIINRRLTVLQEQ